MKTNVTCPECKGSKGQYETNILEKPLNGSFTEITVFVPCYYCSGTGYQSDEEDFEPIIRWT